MCGIVGQYRADRGQIDGTVLERMRDAIAHRGPDDRGLHVDAGVGLGFRRLSILDLSPLGHQPMYSADGRCVIVFNGEIYNFIELRAELTGRGHHFSTDTDTEVILAAYREYGVDCVTRFNGMWAFALWDARTQQLFCSRDRCGVKPFYYYWNGESFVFGSEIKALLEHPGVPRAENRRKSFEYVAFGYLDRDEQTMFEGILQLRPGCSLLLQERKLEVRSYWRPPENVNPGLSWDAAVSGYRDLFIDAVRLRMRSDVPQGLLLSGGQDSSAIAGALTHLQGRHLLTGRSQLHAERLATFSACFSQAELDERPYIDAVVAKGEFHPNYLYPGAKHAQQHFLRTLWANDEPLSTSNTLAHATLLEAVGRSGIKVVLSGQGADDVLAGYDRFVVGYVIREALMRGDLRRAIAEVLAFHRTTGFGRTYIAAQAAKSLLPRTLIPWAKFALIERLPWLINPQALNVYRDNFQGYYYNNDALSRLQAYLLSNLQHDTLPMIVHYEDRGSMQYSIEERFPFLDYRLLEWTLQLPADYLVKQGITKRVMRAAVTDLLPPKVRDRTSKLGFATPTSNWTRQLLGEPRVRDAVAAGSSWLLPPRVVRAVLDGSIPRSRDQFVWRVTNYLCWRRLFEIRDSGLSAGTFRRRDASAPGGRLSPELAGTPAERLLTRPFSRSGALAIVDQGVNSLGNFLATIALGKALHITDFGVYSVLFAAMMMTNGLVNTLVSEPIRTLGVRADARHAAPYVGAQLMTAASIAALGALALTALVSALRVPVVLALSVGAAVLITSIFEVLRALSAARHDWRKVLAADCLAQVLKLAVMGVLLALHTLNLHLAFVGLLVGTSAGVACAWLLGPGPRPPSAEYLKEQVATHFAFGKWLALESLVFNLSTQLYLYIVALAIDLGSAGAYTAAQTLVNAVNILWMGLTSFALPTARAILLRDGAEAWRRWLVETGAVLLVTVGAMLAAISAAAGPLLRLLFSAHFVPYAHLVPLLAVAGILTALNSLFGVAFRTINMPQVGFHGKWVSAVVTAIIAVPLVRSFGAEGAAVGMIVTQLCWTAVYLSALRRMRHTWQERVDEVRRSPLAVLLPASGG